MCFVDLTKAYDSVNREKRWVVLWQRYLFPTKFVRILRALHLDTIGKVNSYGHLSKPFQIVNGVRQGDVLAPFLFNLYFDAVIAMALVDHAGGGVNVLYHPEAALVGNKKKMTERRFVQDLDYADDMCLVAASRDSLEGMLHSVDKACTDMGLTINTKKTKILAVHSNMYMHP